MTWKFWMKESDTLGGKHNLTPPIYFQGLKTPVPPGSTPPWKQTDTDTDINKETHRQGRQCVLCSTCKPNKQTDRLWQVFYHTQQSSTFNWSWSTQRTCTRYSHTNLLMDPQFPSRLSMGFASVPTGKQLAKNSAMGWWALDKNISGHYPHIYFIIYDNLWYILLITTTDY